MHLFTDGFSDWRGGYLIVSRNNGIKMPVPFHVVYTLISSPETRSMTFL